MKVEILAPLSCGIVQVHDLFTEADPSSQTLIHAVKAYIWQCCGVPEGVDELNDWQNGGKRKVTDEMRKTAVANQPARPHFVWSDYRGYGDILARNLRNWGTLVSAGPNVNHNSGNEITTWLFVPNGAFHKEIGWNTRGQYDE